mgnify:CR=1 FL=1|tara:strand:+ start:35 stop:178 length:144 start_codon:yes stop_codon:yes gene_type:complete
MKKKLKKINNKLKRIEAILEFISESDVVDVQISRASIGGGGIKPPRP